MFGRKKKLQNDRDRELEEVLRSCKEWMQREKAEAQGRRKDEEKRFQALERQLEERDAVLREMKEKLNAWEKAFGGSRILWKICWTSWMNWERTAGRNRFWRRN